MAFIFVWNDNSIQTADGYTTVEEALVALKVRRQDIMELEHWEDTNKWDVLFSPGEIDITQLKQ